MEPYERDEKNGLPLPPPIPPNVVPLKVESDTKHKIIQPVNVAQKLELVPMARPGYGREGQRIPLLTNHFRVDVAKKDGYFYHYNVALFYEDGIEVTVEGKDIGRKVLDRVHETYDTELAGKDFAYDGAKSLFTVGALPSNKLKFTVVLEEVSSKRNAGNGNRGGSGSPTESDRKRIRHLHRTKTFKVELSFASKVPVQAIGNALRGQESDNSQEALRVLDIILRQHAAKQGCLLVRQNFFRNKPHNMKELGGGVLRCGGFHSSFRTTQGGLSLNIDVSNTIIIKPGPVLDFLKDYQGVKSPFDVDWAKARRTLKNLRIKSSSTNMEYKVTGLSELPCRQQLFSMKQKSGRDANGDGEDQTIEVTVQDYFVNRHHIELRHSADLPCINVGKPKRPIYLPLELCSLVPLQRYTKALSTFQRSSFVRQSSQKPRERMRILSEELKSTKYSSEPIFRACGISFNSNFTQVEGRVLPAPTLQVGNGVELVPQNGRWNFNKKPTAKIERGHWAIVNFSVRCDLNRLCRDLSRLGKLKGIIIDPTIYFIEENPQLRRAPPNVRVDQMYNQILSKKFHGDVGPRFLLCLLPERKNCNIYGPWKKKTLVEYGVVTQCIVPSGLNDNYLTNVLLKINAKLGGFNSFLAIEHSLAIPIVSRTPTIILGMDVCHGSPGQSDMPSVAAVVGSRQWPLISSYRASVRTQSPKVEMVDSLFKPLNDEEDEGMIRELFSDFYSSSGKKPEHVIIFRDGVSESQFNQVLDIELKQIIEACKHLYKNWCPKFTVIVAQKNHHTRFFQPCSSENVPPGTVIDNKICHPRNYDFYMCSHAGMIGTSRPTHYHVLHDEIGFASDDLQELVHSLSYVYQRSTTAISVVAPVAYAHLAAAQVSTFMKFDDTSETSSGHRGATSAGTIPVPQLRPLHKNVESSMFFC